MISHGVSRVVIGIGNIVIKLPSLLHGQQFFVHGMLGNLLEHEHWAVAHHPQLAPVYHCGPFGLWLVMRRYRQLLTRPLTREEMEAMPFIGIDNNGHNAAMEDGRIVLIDYGNLSWYYDAGLDHA